jgi:hypothetical protein
MGTLVVGIGTGGYFIINGQEFPIVDGVVASLVEGDAGGGVVVFNAVEGAGGALAAAEAEEEEDEELEEDGEEKVKLKSSILQTSTNSQKPTTATPSSTSSSTSSSSSSPPASTPSSYLIFPKDGSNSIANANFERRLRGLSRPNSISRIRIGNSIFMWTADLTSHNATKVQEDSYVSIIESVTA